ncbi:hypothetical protein D3C86_1085470 [compost metagenome]
MPVPVLTSAPPETTLVSPSVVEAFVFRVAPALPITTLRDMFRVAVVCNVPPSSVRPPLSAPRLASPLMASVPALTVHGVRSAVEPLSVQVPVPTLPKLPKLRYLAPISLTAKLLAPVPPRFKALWVPAPLAPTTLPWIFEPVLICSVLSPAVKAMASARVVPSAPSPPLIVPLLVTLMLAPVMATPPFPTEASPPKMAPLLPPLIVPLLLIVSALPTMAPPP